MYLMPNLCPIRKKVLLILVKVNIKRKQTFAKVIGNVHAKRRHKNRTSFVTPDGFRFTVMPFGFIKRCCYVQSYDAGLVE